jgi:outer membrane scaffolding protein for murein synthesis (MipA/OmpV family)
VSRLVVGILVGSITAANIAHASATEDTDNIAYHVTAGPGIYIAPSFPGARGTRKVLFPFVDAEFDNRFYTSAADLVGVYGYKTESTEAGAALQWDLTRRLSRDDERFRNLPNVNETARLKWFASRTVAFVTGDVNLASDVAGHGQGTLAQVNVWFTIPFDPTFSVSVGPGVTWADSEYMRTFYTVTRADSARSSLSAFAARAGIADAHFNGLAEWQLFSHYRIGASAYFARLKADAAASPITVRRTQPTVVGWIAYRFR